MKKYIVFAFIAIISLASCKEDFLVEAPLTSQSDELTLSSLEGIDEAVGGCYSTLASPNWYGAEFIIRNEMKTSNGKKSIVNDSGRLIPDYNINYSPEQTYSGLWNYAYYTIFEANVIIDKIDEAFADYAEAKNFKAECLFLRALAYFDLVRTFAQPYIFTADASHLGVPVVLHKDLEEKPARNTVKEVYAQIEADLLAAEGLIDPSYRRSGTDPASAVSIYAIQALLSRVYLYSQNWQGAADYAAKVIDSGKYSLWTRSDILNVSDESSVYWNDAQTSGEVIFEVYGNKSNSFDGYNDGISPMTTPAGYGDAGASKDLVGLYEITDVRGNLFIATDDNSEFWTAKYAGKGLSNPDVNNTIVIRLSEMYLNRAEALLNGASSSVATATSDLKAICDLRGSTFAASTLTAVYLERQKEFAWEGHLWFDLARTGRPMVREDVLDGVIKTIPYPDYRWAMPIPNHDISANPYMVQNEGYAK